MRTLLLVLAPVTAFGQTTAPPLDAHEIVRRSVSQDQMNWDRAKDYTYISRSVIRERDSHGNITKTEQEVREFFLLYGEPHRRLLEKDGKPLPPEQARREQQKIDQLAEKRRKETEAERARRIENWKRERLKERELTVEIPEAYNFRLLREEVLYGRKTWVVEALPRPEYKPRNWRAGMLKKFKGTMWIDQAEYQWVRLEGEAIDTVSIGLVLARLARGSQLSYEQIRINDEVWMPKLIRLKIDARLALFKRLVGDQEITFSDYRKFQVESRIVSTSAVEERQ